jgi:hypothetical protein
MSDIANPQDTDALFSALGEQLTAAGERYELVVIGGSGLLALGLIERSTRDIDIVALRSGEKLSSAEPLPEPLQAARTHDPSEPFAAILGQVLSHLGVKDAGPRA